MSFVKDMIEWHEAFMNELDDEEMSGCLLCMSLRGKLTKKFIERNIKSLYSDLLLKNRNILFYVDVLEENNKLLYIFGRDVTWIIKGYL